MTIGQDVVLQYSSLINAVGDTLQTVVADAHVQFIDNLDGAGIWPKLTEVWTSFGNRLPGGLAKVKYAQQPSMKNIGFAASSYSQRNGLKGGYQKYLKTGFIPRNFLSPDNCHLSLFIRDCSGSGSTKNYAGCFGEFRIHSLSNRNSLGTNLNRQLSLINQIGNDIFVCGSNTSNNYGYMKKNSDILVEDTTALTPGLLANDELWLYQQNGASASYGINGIIWTYTVGGGLTDDESSFLYEQIVQLNSIRSTL